MRATLHDAMAAILRQDPDQTLRSLKTFDQLHPGGSRATRDLLDRVGPLRGKFVADIGAGLGGPARMLAERGANVIAIDRDPDLATMLTVIHRHLGAPIQTILADARHLPLPTESIDTALAQCVTMTIPDPDEFWAEMARLMKPGGMLLLADIGTGEGAPLRPVPWAPDGEKDYLITESSWRQVLHKTGFRIAWMEDRSQDHAAWYRQIAESPAIAEGPSVVFGPAAQKIFMNMSLNLASGRLRSIEAILLRP